MDGPAWPPPPEGVVTRLISQSDRLAQKRKYGSWEEIFLSGTEPVEYAVADGELDRMDFHFDRDETEEKEKEEPKSEASDEDAIDLSPIPSAQDTDDEFDEPALDLSPIDPLEAKKPNAVQANAVLPKSVSPQPTPIARPSQNE